MKGVNIRGKNNPIGVLKNPIGTILLIWVIGSGCSPSQDLKLLGWPSKPFEYQSIAQNLYCYQLNVFNRLVKRHGFLPNAWDSRSGKLISKKGADKMVQPRMLQYAMNHLLFTDYLAKESTSICGVETFEIVKQSVKKFSKEYTVAIPWKKTHSFEDKVDEPMNIYDIGDWLMVISILAKVSNEPKLRNYLKLLINKVDEVFTRAYQTNNWPGQYSVGFLSKPNPFEIGHATLFIDGLLYAHWVSKLDAPLRLASKLYEKLIGGNLLVLAEVYNAPSSYSTMMTYGELLETISLFHFVTGDKKYLKHGKLLSRAMLTRFKGASNKLHYRLEADKSPAKCIDAMGLEAATYQVLYFLRNDMNKRNLSALIRYLGLFIKFLDKDGFVPQKICGADSNKTNFLLGNQYGVLKTLLFIRNTPSLSSALDSKKIDLDKSIILILKKLLSMKKEFGIPNSIADIKIQDIVDPGGNVWLLNEAIAPFYIDYVTGLDLFNLDSRVHNQTMFVGCNFLFLTR